MNASKAEIIFEVSSPPVNKSPPRPANAFLLYRSKKVAELKSELAYLKQPEVSKRIAKLWKEETEEVRTDFKAQAETTKALHAKRYPGYRYRPRNQRRKPKANGAEHPSTGVSEINIQPPMLKKDPLEELQDAIEDIPHVPFADLDIPRPPHYTLTMGGYPTYNLNEDSAGLELPDFLKSVDSSGQMNFSNCLIGPSIFPGCLTDTINYENFTFQFQPQVDSDYAIPGSSGYFSPLPRRDYDQPLFDPKWYNV